MHNDLDKRIRHIHTELEFQLSEGQTSVQTIVWDRYDTANGARFSYTSLPRWQFSDTFVEQLNNHATELSVVMGIPFDALQ